MSNPSSDVPDSHPRAASLRERALIEHYAAKGLVAETGPIAHGRGEAFDYLLGEVSIPPVEHHTRLAAAILLLAKHPVISINGNVAALAAKDAVLLGKSIPAPLEVNIFYKRTENRERLIAEHLRANGACEVLGVAPEASVPGLASARGRVDSKGIAIADVVLVMLEDGDRTQALRRLGKTVISVDLNPFSRSARDASINICDNVTRALPNLLRCVESLKSASTDELHKLAASVDNQSVFRDVVQFIITRLSNLANPS